MDTPQFQKAEYAGAGGDRCKMCGTALGAAYWRVGTNMTCQACAEKVESAIPQDSHSAFTRGVLFGIGGAVVGLILYATFTIVTKIELGYVSLAVGYIVGKSIRMGSNNMTGRRYQIAAAILTYAAVSLAWVPIVISQGVRPQSGEAILRLALFGIASPFIGLAGSGFGGIIGLVILLVGIRIAWQITGAQRIPPVSGPFRNTSAAAAPAAPPPAAPPPLG